MSCVLKWFAVLTLLLSRAALSETLQCSDYRFRVSSQDEALAKYTCAVASRAATRLADCNVIVTRPVLFELKDEMPDGCIGLYHCGEDRIELPTLETLQRIRKPDSSLSHLPLRVFFESALTHELAHQAFDTLPCPFDGCLIASEYLAYNMQIMSLPSEHLAAFEAKLEMDIKVPRDALNPILLFMAPDTFMLRAWTHLNQRPDACAFIDDVMQGRIRMDNPHP